MRFLIFRTPSITGLSNLPELSPDLQAVIIIRDGRDVIASGMKSFDWKLEQGALQYATSVGFLIEQLSKTELSNSILIVKY